MLIGFFLGGAVWDREGQLEYMAAYGSAVRWRRHLIAVGHGFGRSEMLQASCVRRLRDAKGA